jgi:[acyl-carrier-protein] S-malonyltransferase
LTMQKKLAFVFPGQGSQYVGMGKTFLETVPGASDVFAVAEEITGIPVGTLCLEGPMEELTKTAYLQPCLTAVEIICCMAARGAGLKPEAVAGHSLGEYAALWAAGVLDLRDTFALVHARGSLMEEAGARNPGAMAAVIGLTREQLQELIDPLATKGILALANHNSPEQIVVTGESNLVNEICKAAKGHGARAIPLNVSGAYHSPMMKEASESFAAILADTRFLPPAVTVYSNVTAKSESDPEEIKRLMAQQICAPVRWVEVVTAMSRSDISDFIELGPKKVLSNLIRKTLPSGSCRTFQVEDPEGLEACKKEI